MRLAEVELALSEIEVGRVDEDEPMRTASRTATSGRTIAVRSRAHRSSGARRRAAGRRRRRRVRRHPRARRCRGGRRAARPPPRRRRSRLRAPARSPSAAPTSFLSAVRPSTIATICAAVHHGDPVAQLEDLVELGRDEQDGRSGVALLDRLAVDELDAADVEAARRLVEDEQLQVAVELARDDDLLLVPARQRARADPRPTASGRRTSSIAARAALVDRVVVAQDPAGVRRAVVARSGRGCRRPRTAGRARTGGGRPGRRRRQPRSSRAGWRPVTSLPSSATVPAGRLAQADDRLDELVLAVAGHAGDAEDLAGPDLEVDARGRPRCRGRRGTRRPPTSRTDLAGMGLAAIDRRARPRGRPSARRGPPRSVSAGQPLADDACPAGSP